MTPLAHGIGHSVSLASSGAVKPANPFPLLFYVPFDDVGSSPAKFSLDIVKGGLPAAETTFTGYATGGVIGGHLLNTGDTSQVMWDGESVDNICFDYGAMPFTVEIYTYIRSASYHTVKYFVLTDGPIFSGVAYGANTIILSVYSYSSDKKILVEVTKNSGQTVQQEFLYAFDAVWNHYAVCSDGVNLYVCANGKIVGVIPNVAANMPVISKTAFTRQFAIYTNDWHVKLDNLAISSGCRYSGNVGDDYVLPTARYAV